MKYWWVNHKQTFKAELGGGYIWSPSKNNGGSYNQGYVNLTLAKIGDPIFSYGDTYIRAVGVITKEFVHSAVPEDFGVLGTQWAKEGNGYLVKVKWHMLDIPFKPKEFITEIRDLLPFKYSPIQTTGRGNQGIYLSEISIDLFTTIIDLLNQQDSFVIPYINASIEIAKEDAEQDSILHSGLSLTEKEQLIKARIGQGRFKTEVAKIESRCRVTKLTDIRFLIASHIKPWTKCNNQERLDGSNGLLLSPHIDRLFDKGWISFTDGGDILVAKSTPDQIIKSWNIKLENVGTFQSKQKTYLEYHRTFIFSSNKNSFLF